MCDQGQIYCYSVQDKKKEGLAIQPSANVASICSYIQNIPQIHKQLATNAYLSFTSQLRIKAA